MVALTTRMRSAWTVIAMLVASTNAEADECVGNDENGCYEAWATCTVTYDDEFFFGGCRAKICIDFQWDEQSCKGANCEYNEVTYQCSDAGGSNPDKTTPAPQTPCSSYEENTCNENWDRCAISYDDSYLFLGCRDKGCADFIWDEIGCLEADCVYDSTENSCASTSTTIDPVVDTTTIDTTTIDTTTIETTTIETTTSCSSYQQDACNEAWDKCAVDFDDDYNFKGCRNKICEDYLYDEQGCSNAGCVYDSNTYDCSPRVTTTSDVNTTPDVPVSTTADVPADHVLSWGFGNVAQASIQIYVGETVQWNLDQGDGVHTVTSDLFSSGQVLAGGSFRFKFTSEGEVAYVCDYHANMKATITVRFPSTSAETTTESTPKPIPTLQPTSAPVTSRPTAMPTSMPTRTFVVEFCAGFKTGTLCEPSDKSGCHIGKCSDSVCYTSAVANDVSLACYVDGEDGICVDGGCAITTHASCGGKANGFRCTSGNLCMTGNCFNQQCLVTAHELGSPCNYATDMMGVCTSVGNTIACATIPTTTPAPTPLPAPNPTTSKPTPTPTRSPTTSTPTKPPTSRPTTSAPSTQASTITSTTTGTTVTSIIPGDVNAPQDKTRVASFDELNTTVDLVISGAAIVHDVWYGKLRSDKHMQRAITSTIENVAESKISAQVDVIILSITNNVEQTEILFQVTKRSAVDTDAQTITTSLEVDTVFPLPLGAGFSSSSWLKIIPGSVAVAFEESDMVLGKTTPAPASGIVGAVAADDSNVDSTAVAVGILFVVLVVAIIGYIGYRKLYNERQYDLPGAEKNVYGSSLTETMMNPGGMMNYSQKRTRTSFKGELRATNMAYTAALMPYNRSKNRDLTRIPYDETRVVVAADPEVRGSGYVNASTIPGYGSTTYVAAQGPLKHTAAEFWRMVIDQKCSVVAMIGQCGKGDKDKCFQFWPTLKDKGLSFNGTDGSIVTVACSGTSEPVADCAEFALEITVTKESVTQMLNVALVQYRGWPLQIAPVDPSSFIEFYVHTKSLMKDESPVAVVDDFGTGRTGVFMALDTELDRYINESTADIFETVVAMRRNRPNMIETITQYMFTHNAFIDFIMKQPLIPTPKVSPEHAAFIRKFRVPKGHPYFDLGQAGRKILSIGKCSLASVPSSLVKRFSSSSLPPARAPSDGPMAMTLVVCTDVVILTSVEGNQIQLLHSIADRTEVHIKSFMANTINLKIGSPLVLDFENSTIALEWKQRLEGRDSYQMSGELRGARMVALRPTTRKEAAQILGVGDPGTAVGLAELDSEFESIPKSFQPTELCDDVDPDPLVQDDELTSTGMYENASSKHSLSNLPMITPGAMTRGGLGGQAPQDNESIARKLGELEVEIATAEHLKMQSLEVDLKMGTSTYMDVVPGVPEFNVPLNESGYMDVVPLDMLSASVEGLKKANERRSEIVATQMRTLAHQTSLGLLTPTKPTSANENEAPPQSTPVVEPSTPIIGQSALEKIKARVQASRGSASPQSMLVNPIMTFEAPKPTQEELMYAVPTAVSPPPTPQAEPKKVKKAWAPPAPTDGGFTITKGAMKRIRQRDEDSNTKPVVDEEMKAAMRASGLIVPE